MKEEQAANDVDWRVISVHSMRRMKQVVVSFLNADESFAAAIDTALRWPASCRGRWRNRSAVDFDGHGKSCWFCARVTQTGR